MTYEIPKLTIGLDLGDREHSYAVIDEAGELVSRGTVSNTRSAMGSFLRPHGGARVVMETGTHSPWLSRLCHELGLEVLVGNSRKLRAIYQNPRKDDPADAELLARIGRFDPQLLCPITHRGAQAQAHLALLKARDQLVASRSKLIAHVRSQVKSFGDRLPGSISAPAFHYKVRPLLVDELRPALEPLLDTIELLTTQIRHYEQRLEALADEYYPETHRLRQIKGVGRITALAFVLTLEDPTRFPDPRDVGAWLGLTPRRDQSGSRDPNLGISKAGNAYLRRLLVEAARYILGPFGEDCDLRRYGLRLLQLPPDATAEQIKEKTSHAKNRAVVAVARKLAVLLRVLWLRGEPYQPLRHAA